MDRRKTTRRMLPITFVLCLALAISVNCFAMENTKGDNPEKTFNVVVRDDDEKAVEDADVYLYSFLDGKIVASSVTNNIGETTIEYRPNIEFDGNYVYGDYLIYVQKDGLISAQYNCTKIYLNPEATNTEDMYSVETTNKEKHIIHMAKDKGSREEQVTITNNPRDLVMQKIHDALVKDGKLSVDNPIAVIRETDYRQFVEEGILREEEVALINEPTQPLAATADSGLTNKRVSIGKFHVSKGAKLNVTFYATDSLKIEVGTVESSLGTVGISGSRTRGFAATSRYAQFTTTNNTARKTYYTMADFEKWEVIQYYGLTRTHIGLKRINGGTETGSVSTCSVCNKAYNSVPSLSGTYIPIQNGSNISIAHFRNKTVTLSSKVSFANYGLNLGIDRITGGSADLTYSPKSGYNLRIYNNGTNVWHSTQTAI